MRKSIEAILHSVYRYDKTRMNEQCPMKYFLTGLKYKHLFNTFNTYTPLAL